MIKVIIAIVASLLLISGANAQQFPGYGPSGGIFVAQGNSLLPTWLFLNGDCTSTVGAAIVCTKTNGVPFYTGLSAPVNPSDAATKNYVDMNSTGLAIHTAVALGTAAALPANTYNNGTAGVGATLTSTCVSSCPAPTVDGTAVTIGQRILVKNEVAPANNGIYTVTTVGTGSTPYVLTRATDANVAGTQDPNKIGAGTYVLVTGGTVNLNNAWTVVSTVTTIGTSAINWGQFSASSGVSSIGGLQGAFTCSSGINCASNILALTAARQTLPTHQVFTSGSGTYTRPANVLWIEITLVGGGGGGGGAGGTASSGAATCWNTTGAACTTPLYSVGGGVGGGGGGSGGTGGAIGAGTCDWSVVGGSGGGGAQSVVGSSSGVGGIGGSSTLGGAGASNLNANGSSAAANSGSGGGGGGAQSGASLTTGGGGGSGATCHVIINNPASTYTYTVGAGGSGGSAVSFGWLGGPGGAGQIIVYEHYGS